MIRKIFLTSWKHMTGMPYASGGVISALTTLFVTVFVASAMMTLLLDQKSQLIQKFTYPLFLTHGYQLDNPRVEDFIADISQKARINEGVTLISKEEALDEEIKRDPAILRVLSGENPFPDVIMVPLYGSDIAELWSSIQAYRDMFDSIDTLAVVESRLKKFDTSLENLSRIFNILIFFLVCIFVMMLILVYSVTRYHIRLFHSELIIGRLVGAEPYFFWGPHVVSALVYTGVSYGIALLIFRLLSLLF